MNDSSSAPILSQALKRGLLCRCPACGEGRLFGRFLKPVARCAECGHDWTVKRADDFPAYLVVLILGHLLIPVVVEANLHYDMPMLAQMIAWPLLATVLALAMLQPMKGFVLALLWAR